MLFVSWEEAERNMSKLIVHFANDEQWKDIFYFFSMIFHFLCSSLSPYLLVFYTTLDYCCFEWSPHPLHLYHFIGLKILFFMWMLKNKRKESFTNVCHRLERMNSAFNCKRAFDEKLMLIGILLVYMRMMMTSSNFRRCK
jgi:hypothetical protein